MYEATPEQRRRKQYERILERTRRAEARGAGRGEFIQARLRAKTAHGMLTHAIDERRD